MLGLGLSIPQLAVRGLRLTDLAAAIRSLFAAGEQGVWYDPSDMSTMFQDAAGTTPVTAVEQPVGLMLDKSGRGNHATQTTSTSRPVLSARVNLLTKTEQFDDAYWNYDAQNLGLIRTKNATTDPNGGNTGNKIALAPNKSASTGYIGVSTPLSNGKFQLYAKPAEYSYLILTDGAYAGGSYAVFNLSNGTIFKQSSSGTSAISPAANGYYLCSLTTPSNNYLHAITTSPDGRTDSSGDGTSGIYIWGADLRVANAGVNLPPYQRVNTATDYDTVGFPHYLRFDGVDDFLVTNSINFSSTAQVTAFSGSRKLSDASSGYIAELGFGGTGKFELLTPYGAATNVGIALTGSTSTSVATVTGKAAPITSVITGKLDLSTATPALQNIVRYNGADAATGAVNAGTGTFSNLALNIGRRANASGYFNGQLYSLIVRGAQSTEQQIIDAETYINSKTKAYA